MPAREHTELIDWFNAYEDATVDARAASELHRDYYDGIQWTQAEVDQLKKRKQPVVTFNRIAPKVDFVLGMEMQTRTDPKAYPRNPGMDEKSAEAATDALRFIADNSRMDNETSLAGQNLLIEGTCGGEVVLDFSAGEDPQIKIRHIPWDRLFWDPRSRFADFSDAKYKGVVVWMDVDDAREMFPGKEDVLNGMMDEGGRSGDTFDDRPRNNVWWDTDGRRPRVKIVQIWYRDYSAEKQQMVWYHAVYTRSGYVKDPEISPFADQYGRTICPLILQSAKLDRDNNRYGMVKHLVSPQDEINKRRSKALHLLNSRQTISEKGALDDVRQAKQELAKPDGHVTVNPGLRFEMVPNTDLTQGQLSLLQEAKAELDAVSANAALTGADPRVLSGRAIEAKQQGGLVELQPFFDSLRHWKLNLYRIAWDFVRQFWTYEKWFRVTDSEEMPRYVGLNKPVRMLDLVKAQGVEVDMNSPIPERLAMRLTEVVAVENDVANLDVDVVLDEGPSWKALAQEQFEQLALMASRGVPIPPDVIIEASSLRNKNELLRMLRGDPEDPQFAQQAQMRQMQQQMQLQAQQLELAQRAATIEKTKAQTFESVTDAEKNRANAVESLAKAEKQGTDTDIAEASAVLRALGLQSMRQ